MPIDAVKAIPDVQVVGACVMSCRYVVGDHWLFVIDILTGCWLVQNPLMLSKQMLGD